MHRYYIHVLDSLLQHKSTYAFYQIRHPFPPYATHYITLLLLSHLFSFDIAEKIFVCLILVVFAWGLRLSGKRIGPAGPWITLLFVPLALSWPLMMGFFNFTLGVSLLLLATACWQGISGNRGSALAAFAAVLLVLTFTHPIPLLLLILLCALDLLLSLVLRPNPAPLHAWFREHKLQCIALALTLAAAAFPAMAMDPSKTHSTLSLIGFHSPFVRTSLLLTGLSPYNSRSLKVSIDVYRLCLWVTYLAGMAMGAWAAVRCFRQRRANFGVTVFLATLALTLALPFLPNFVNGSDFFATRLIFVLWPGALLAASAAPLTVRSQQVTAVAAAVFFCIATLIPAQIYIRPLAHDLRRAELEPLPTHARGALLLAGLMDEYVRHTKQLAFNPLEWAPVLAFVSQNDVALDSPWIDQKITPLMAAPGSPLLVDDIALTPTSTTNPPLVPGRCLPGAREAQIVRDSSFFVYSGSPANLAQGLSQQLSPSEAEEFQCAASHGSYRVCLKKEQYRNGQ